MQEQLLRKAAQKEAIRAMDEEQKRCVCVCVCVCVCACVKGAVIEKRVLLIHINFSHAVPSRRIEEAPQSPKGGVSDAQVEVLEQIARKASIKKAKEMADTTQQEYILAEQKARAQEDTVRKIHQKQADKAMEVSGPILIPFSKYRSQNPSAPHSYWLMSICSIDPFPALQIMM